MGDVGLGGRPVMLLVPATGAAVVSAYKGNRTVRAPWSKVKVVPHVPMYLNGWGSQP